MAKFSNWVVVNFAPRAFSRSFSTLNGRPQAFSVELSIEGALRVIVRRWWAANSWRVCARSLKSKRRRARPLTWPSARYKASTLRQLHTCHGLLTICGTILWIEMWTQPSTDNSDLTEWTLPEGQYPNHFNIFSVVDLRGIIFGKTWKCQANWLQQRCGLLRWKWKKGSDLWLFSQDISSFLQ